MKTRLTNVINILYFFRNIEMTSRILHEHWRKQKNLRRLFPKYKPKKLSKCPINLVTRAELTTELYKFSNHSVHSNELFRTKVLWSNYVITLTIRGINHQMKIVNWQSTSIGKGEQIYYWSNNLSYYAITEELLRKACDNPKRIPWPLYTAKV